MPDEPFLFKIGLCQEALTWLDDHGQIFVDNYAAFVLSPTRSLTLRKWRAFLGTETEIVVTEHPDHLIEVGGERYLLTYLALSDGSGSGASDVGRWQLEELMPPQWYDFEQGVYDNGHVTGLVELSLLSGGLSWSIEALDDPPPPPPGDGVDLLIGPGNTNAWLHNHNMAYAQACGECTWFDASLEIEHNEGAQVNIRFTPPAEHAGKTFLVWGHNDFVPVAGEVKPDTSNPGKAILTLSPCGSNSMQYIRVTGVVR